MISYVRVQNWNSKLWNEHLLTFSPVLCEQRNVSEFQEDSILPRLYGHRIGVHFHQSIQIVLQKSVCLKRESIASKWMEEQFQCYLEENVPVRTAARIAVIVEIVEIQAENANSLFLPTLKNETIWTALHCLRGEPLQRRRKGYSRALAMCLFAFAFCSLLFSCSFDACVSQAIDAEWHMQDSSQGQWKVCSVSARDYKLFPEHE